MAPDAMARVPQLLAAEDFYRGLHQKIYQAALRLFERGKSIDIETVAEELRRQDQLNDVGGKEYLSALVDVCPSSARIEVYARVVREKSELRRLDNLME